MFSIQNVGTLGKFGESDPGEVGSEDLNLPGAGCLVAGRLSQGLPSISTCLPLAHFSRGRLKRERGEHRLPSVGKCLISQSL